MRFFINLESVGVCRRWRGRVFHALAARKEKELLPVLVFLMRGTVARENWAERRDLWCVWNERWWFR